MKRVQLILIISIYSLLSAKAQVNSYSIFTVKNGTVFINETYNAEDILLSTSIFEVGNENNLVTYKITDKKGKLLNKGSLEVKYSDQIPSYQMVNRTLLPEIIKSLNTDTEFVGDFLDYPNFIASNNSKLLQKKGNYLIQTRNNKNGINVKIYNREFDTNERVITPAGVFKATKVKFDLEIIQRNQTTKYECIEWYSMGDGIVRSETYDAKSNLICYTILSKRE